MANIRGRTFISHYLFFAVFTLLAVIIPSGNSGLAQGLEGRAIDQTQRAVRNQITDRESGRNLMSLFNRDARTEYKSSNEVLVRGTGIFSRNNDGKSRNFSYEAVFNNRNSNVSDIRYDWRGDWYHGDRGGRNDINRLTGTYRLDQSRSDNPATVADRVARNVSGKDQQRLRNSIMRRLESPDSLAIEREGRTITIASSRARQVTFEADGREHSEQSRNGRVIRTKATLNGDRLTVNTEGDRSVDYRVIFEPAGNGQQLRVTRRISDDENLRQQVVAYSIYEKTSTEAQFNLHSGARYDYPSSGVSESNFLVPDGTELVAVLNDNLNTNQAHEGDRFTLTVRSPSQFDGAIIEGHLVKVNRSGQVSGRAEISFDFDSIRLRNRPISNFDGYIENIRTTSGETLRVNNEGRVQDDSNQTTRTVTRAGIGAAIGAVIGAIAGGGKGAAIGAGVGAGAGVGSIFIQGREDLKLMSGTEFMIRSSAPR